MEQKATVTIKLKPYLQEYVRGRLEDKLSADSKNIIGKFIKPFLGYTPKDHLPVFSQNSEYITFELPIMQKPDNRFGTVYVSEKNQIHFQKILECHFKDLFYQYMDDKIRYDILINDKRVRGGQIKNVILQFCSDYGITFDDLTYDLLQKSYYRRRKKIMSKTNIFPDILSLTCPLTFLIQ